MENASKALLIAGAILLAILIIAIGMYIYNSAQSTIQDSVTSMSTYEIDSFNNNFTSYEGQQQGSNVKALIGRLIANANTYTEEPGKVPNVTVVDKICSEGNETKNVKMENPGANNVNNYVTELGQIRNKIESKHPYWVEMVYGSSGLIVEIKLTYGKYEDGTWKYNS